MYVYLYANIIKKYAFAKEYYKEEKSTVRDFVQKFFN